MSSSEKFIKESIESGEYPFLYMYENVIPEDRLGLIKSFLDIGREDGTGLFKFYIYCLEKSPASYSFYLINELNKRVGGNDEHFNIHGHINEILGENLNINQQKKLWELFRRACKLLGLSISSRTSGSNYIVNEFKRHMGIPNNYIAELTEKFISFANKAGVPTVDDLDGIHQWESRFCEKYDNSLPNFIIDTLNNDDYDFHVNSFVKLFNLREDATITFSYETVMLNTINNANNNKLYNSKFPQILFNDDSLGVLLPGNTDWQITKIDSEKRSGLENKKFSLFDKDKFVPFDDIIYSVSVIDDSGNDFKFNVWKNSSEQILFFNEKGQLKKSLSFQDEKTEIKLNPGDYIILSRERIFDDWLEIDPCLNIYKGKLSLSPGDTNELINSQGQKLQISIKETPFIQFESQPYIDSNKLRFYASSNIVLTAYIPNISEIIENDIALKISDIEGNKVINTDYYIEDKFIKFNLSETLNQFSYGLYRYKLEITYKNKPQVRTSEFIWNGLETIKDAEFYCYQLPTNLKNTENIKLLPDKEKYIIKDKLRHNFIFNFKINSYEIKSLVWNKPGVSLYLDLINNYNEIPIEIGQSIAVSPASRTQLIIYSDKNIEITANNFNKKLNFNRISKQTIQLASLIEYTKENKKIYYKVEGEESEFTLIELISLHTVKEYSYKIKHDLCKINFTLNSNPEKLLLKFDNLLEDKNIDIELKLLDGLNDYHLFNRTNVKIDKAGNNIELCFNSRNWDDGWWLINYEFLIAGKWGRPTNNREDYYSNIVVINANNFYNKWQIDFLFDKENDYKLVLFEKIHNILQKCYSRESWENFEWLKKIWYKILKPLSKENKPEIISKLLKLSLNKRNQDTPESWIPLMHIGAYRPKIYSWNVDLYNKFKFKNTWKEQSIKELSKIDSAYERVYNGEYLHIISMFNNFLNVSQGQEEYFKDLKIENFKNCIESNEDSLLCMNHYKYCLIKLRNNYEKTLSGYNYHRGRALSLLRNLKFNNGLFKKAYNLPIKYQDIFEENMIFNEQMYENLDNFAKYLSLYAMLCRLENRKPDTLKRFYQSLNFDNSNEFKEINSYVLGIGESLFCYFLLFWEIIFQLDNTILEDINE